MSSVAQATIAAPVADGMAATARWLDERLFRDDVPDVDRLMQHVTSYSGKRLRPMLVHLCGGLVDGAPGDEVASELAQVGAIMEALHMATLLHDDVLDEATVRRQVPTLNGMHGNQVPVLLGDLVYARAFDLSLRLSSMRAAREISRMTQAVCKGEIEQSVARFDGRPDEQRYYRIIRGKTAEMFATSALLGAVYAGGDEHLSAAMARYGMELGLAFQIIDDCLDVVGDEDVVGKSLGTDLETGKVTLPLIRLAAALDEADRQRLLALVSAPADETPGGDRRARLLASFDLGPAVAACHATADEHLHRALAELDDVRPCAERDSLRAVCHFVLQRSH